MPELLNEFESLFWQQRFVAAHAKVARAVAALSGREHEYGDYWIDASLKLSRKVAEHQVVTFQMLSGEHSPI